MTIINMLFVYLSTAFIALAAASEDWTNPKDVLLNPRGQKVCMQQCGTRELLCPEAFFREQNGPCYRCCSTWGETVIRIECKDRHSKNSSDSKLTNGWAGNATTSSMRGAASGILTNSTDAHPTEYR
ncbi:hypothetical protein T440DRAFT_396100 [Plenodomus tracheiphilus IPT5]|uniref:Uncharacterized protein n=1 Tax=Plenodomus tracheiphilus IPT5 TaxID=1408161 RepID=A0A6A7B935_9PLEO|nr:hypothetical protein T440DRAFT_396100 [Plenodomus tracheiphilus IPT5]